MSISLCVLASGSSGNCSLVRTPAGVFMIDCGIGPRTAAGRMKETGVAVSDIVAVCLTHLDRDHFNPNWASTFARQQVRVFVAGDCVDEIIRIANNSAFAKLVEPFRPEKFDILPGVSMQTSRLAHDDDGSHAFVIDCLGTKLGYATDLGHVPADLIEKFCGVDLLAIESNYDPEMQRTSGRPWFLQNRITGGRGHLSNDQCYSAVKAIFDRCQKRNLKLPSHVVLLHRSGPCNCPNLVQELFRKDARLASRITLSEQTAKTNWLTASQEPYAGQQLNLFAGSMLIA